jgi:hypothetical protein
MNLFCDACNPKQDYKAEASDEKQSDSEDLIGVDGKDFNGRMRDSREDSICFVILFFRFS